MKSFFKKVLLFVIDAVTLILAYYVSYYAVRLLGMESSSVLINSSYIFAAVKIIIYLAFVMYSTKSTRNFLLDVLGIVVANAAACAVAMFLFEVNLMDNIVALAIVLVWDMLIGLMIRFLIRNPANGGYDDEYEDDDEEYYSPADRDKLNNYVGDDTRSIESVLGNNSVSEEDKEFSDTGSVLSSPDERDAEAEMKEAEDAMHQEYLEKIQLLENELKAKEEHIDELESEMSLDGVDFESFAPPEEEEPVEEEEEEEPEAEEKEQEEPAPENGYAPYEAQPQMYTADPYAQQYGQYPPYMQQPYQDPRYQQPQQLQWPPSPYDTNFDTINTEQIKQKATEIYKEQHKQELLDGILKDIKSMYSTLTTKTKSLEEKEYDLLLKYVELDEREKTLAAIKERNEARSAACELAYEIQKAKKTRARQASDEMLLPSDNLSLTKNIKKTLDILQGKSAPPFVLAEEPFDPENAPVKKPVLHAEPAKSQPAENTLASQLMNATGKVSGQPHISAKPVKETVYAAEPVKKPVAKQGIKDASEQVVKLREMLSEEAQQAKKKVKTASSPIERAMQQTQQEMDASGISASAPKGAPPSEIINQIDEIRREIKNNEQSEAVSHQQMIPPVSDPVRDAELKRMHEAQEAQYRAQQAQMQMYAQHTPPYPVQNPNAVPPVPPLNAQNGNMQGYIPPMTNPNRPMNNGAANMPQGMPQQKAPVKQAEAQKPKTAAKPKAEAKAEAKAKAAKPAAEKKLAEKKKTPVKNDNIDFKGLETGSLNIKSEEFDSISSLLDDL